MCVSRLRWYNHLNPDILKTPWDPAEDRVIIEVRTGRTRRGACILFLFVMVEVGAWRIWEDEIVIVVSDEWWGPWCMIA